MDRRGIYVSLAWMAVGAATIGCAAVALGATTPAWPPFLPPAQEFPRDVAERVERVWRDPTLTRTVHGERATVPFELYRTFVDAPDVTAAAARFLELGQQQVRSLGDDVYEADDRSGAHGYYRVLVREPHRRVLLSWGEHHGRLLGTVKGSAITIVRFTPNGDGVDQELTTYVLIDNAIAARLARLLVPVFGSIADRKLAEGFAITAKVATWAATTPAEFCDWLGNETLPAVHRDAVVERFRECRDRPRDGSHAARSTR